MLFIIFSAVILIIAATILKIKYNMQFVPILCIMLTTLFINGIILTVDYSSQTTSQEVWSGKIINVKHIEEYTEPSYYETVVITDSKGKSKTKSVYHPPVYHASENYIITSDNGSKMVYSTLDGNKFTDNFVNNNNELLQYYPIGMSTASVHVYENKVQASYSTYKHQDVNLHEYPELPEYPKVVNNNFTIDRIIGDIPNKEKNLELLNKYNSKLNDTENPNNKDGKKSYKQLNIIFVNLGDVTDDYGFALQDYWQGGNKNDFVISFGSKDSKITWCYPFSWSDSELVKIQIKDYMMEKSNLNKFDQTIIDVSDLLEEGYERKQFADFSYLDIEVRTGAKIFMILITFAGIGALIFYKNE